MLKLNNVEVKYTGGLLALSGLSLEVPDRDIVVLLGSNGAGKTTILKAISGLLPVEGGKITKGSIVFDDVRIDYNDPQSIVRMGISQVMEGRRIFEHLTVEENLVTGAHLRNDRAAVKRDLEMVYSYFPQLKTLRRGTSGYLSGGEQQMLVIGRAMMSACKLMLVDEPSLGLAPIVAKDIFAVLQTLNRELGVAVLLVEQKAKAALDIAMYGYVIGNGEVVLEGSSHQLKTNENIKEFYLGLTSGGEMKSFKAMKIKR